MMSLRILAAALLASALTSVWGAAWGAAPVAAAEPVLKIVNVDVEGGGGTIFLTPEGKSLLIDTGWPAGFGMLPSPDAPEAADRIVAAAKKLGIRKFDYVLITHYHTDHAGGVTRLLSKMPVDTFIDHGANVEPLKPGGDAARIAIASETLYQKYLAATKGHKRITVKPGDVIRIGSLTNTIVASDDRLIARPLPGAGARGANCNVPLKGPGGPENEHSIASLLTFGTVKIAQFGDLNWDNEYQLACPVDRIGHVNLLIVTQHGSDISSNPAQLAAMKPDVAIMGSGGKKGGDVEVIDNVARLPGLMGFWRVHEAFRYPELSGDKNYVANLNPPREAVEKLARTPYDAPPDQGHAILAEVTAAGGITVTNERNGFRKTYRVK